MKTKNTFLLSLLLLGTINLFATNYTSVNNGLWSDPNTWSPAGVPNVTNSSAWPGDNVTISHAVIHATGSITTAKKSSISISATGSLSVSGNLVIANTSASSFDIASGGILTALDFSMTSCCNTVSLNGVVSVVNFNYSGSKPISIGGNISIANDFSASGGGTINFTGGTFEVDGISSLSNSIQINIDGGTVTDFGDLSITGSADITGVGTGGSIAFNSLSLQNSSTTITCVSNQCNYNGTTPNPPNPLDLMTGAQVLPVSLLDFTATAADEKILLNWSTTAEVNNDFFLLEHSIDGRNFTEVATISGKGTSSKTTDYEHLHRETAQGNNFYRLWQYDFDGSHTSLGLQKVFLSSTKEPLVEISPNPCIKNQSVNIKLIDSYLEINQVKLMSMDGRSWTLSLNNTNTVDLPANLVSGLYYLQTTVGNHTTTSSLLIQ